jgi:hypothetical protein
MQAAMHAWWGHVLLPTGTKGLWWWGGEVPVGLNMSPNTKGTKRGTGTALPRSGRLHRIKRRAARRSLTSKGKFGSPFSKQHTTNLGKLWGVRSLTLAAET